MASNPGRNHGTVYGASWVAGRGEATIRKYYYLGGRGIAMRVDGDENPANNGLFYFHSDHPATSAGL